MRTGPVDDVAQPDRRAVSPGARGDLAPPRTRSGALRAVARPQEAPPSRETVASRRELLETLRRIAVHLETASVLELRADRSASPTLAVVLRERAVERRRTAERLRAALAAQGLLRYRPRRPEGAARRTSAVDTET